MNFPTRTTLTLAFALLASLAASAQTTTTYTVPPVFCGALNGGAYYCPTMSITAADGNHHFFYEPYYNGHLNHVSFYDLAGNLGWDGMGESNVTSVSTTATPGPNQTTTGTQTTTFLGTDSAGLPFSGVVSITFSTYYTRGGGGRGCGGCGTKWTITGGTVTVTR